jgi:8-amino-3,8-dideoxy-alpha-D-manno-octulosonate transaminase
MANNTKIKVKLPQEWPGTHYLGQEEIDAVTRVLKAKSPFRYYGPDPQFEARQLEAELAAFIGVSHCVAVSNGTTALQVALSALDVGPGDEVIMPGYFWVSTVGAVVRSGAIPVLADIDKSFYLDPDDLEKKISERTKVVIVVPMGGVIGQISKIADICRTRGIKLLEDCAQAAGASQFGKMAGSFGDISILSFQINKNMNAGEGGAVLMNNPDLYKKAFAIHDTGYDKDESGDFILNDEKKQFWGIGCRMSDITAAVARKQLKKLPEITKAMRVFKNELKEILSEYDGPVLRHVEDPEGDSGGFLKMTFKDRRTAYEFKDALIANGIEVEQGGFYPIHMEQWGLHIYYNNPSLVNKRASMGRYSVWELSENSFARDYSYQKGTLPKLDAYVERTVFFCIASKLTEVQKDVIRNAFVNTCEQLNFLKIS